MSASPHAPVAGLEAIFDQMRPALVRRAAALGAAADAEDVVHDVWLKLGKAEGPIANPGGYLLRMVYTAVLDRRRAERRATARDTSWSAPANPGEETIDTVDAERRLIALQTLRAVEARLDRLGDPAASIFRRHRIDGVRQRELAQEFGMGLSTVEKHLRLAYAVLLDLAEGLR